MNPESAPATKMMLALNEKMFSRKLYKVILPANDHEYDVCVPTIRGHDVSLLMM
jgi:hypothetical protein